MRPIKFRGKRTDNGEWVKGIYMPETRSHLTAIGTFIEGGGYWDWNEVIPETVGQYTGWKDAKGNMIFESDILQHAQSMILKVVWDSDGMWLLEDEDGQHHMLFKYVKVSKVIGNIHNNPDLLEVR